MIITEYENCDCCGGEEEMIECTTCGTAPLYVTVTVDSVASSYCTNCEIYHGTHTLTHTGFSHCTWSVNLGELGCMAGAVISLSWSSFYSRWQIGFAGTATYTQNTWDCTTNSPVTFTLDAGSVTGACTSWPATVTLN
jgi:hypothetical protein